MSFNSSLWSVGTWRWWGLRHPCDICSVVRRHGHTVLLCEWQSCGRERAREAGEEAAGLGHTGEDAASGRTDGQRAASQSQGCHACPAGTLEGDSRVQGQAEAGGQALHEHEAGRDHLGEGGGEEQAFLELGRRAHRSQQRGREAHLRAAEGHSKRVPGEGSRGGAVTSAVRPWWGAHLPAGQGRAAAGKPSPPC